MQGTETLKTSLLARFSTYAHAHIVSGANSEPFSEEDIESAARIIRETLEILESKHFSASIHPAELAYEVGQRVGLSAALNQLVFHFFEDNSLSQANILLLRYVLALKNEGCSISTIKNYRSDISQFFEFTGETALLKMVTKPKLQAFLAGQKAKGLASSSIRRKLVSITQFGIWLEVERIVAAHTFKWLVEFSERFGADSLPLAPSYLAQKTNNTHEEDVNRLKGSSKGSNWRAFVFGNATRSTSPLEANSSILAKSTSPLKSQEKRFQVKQGLYDLRSKLQARSQQYILPYLNLMLSAILFLGMGYFGYLQLFGEVEQPLAYPTALTRPNRTLSFQGRLTDTNQNPIISASDMRFRLYDSGPSTSGGSLLWDSGTCSVIPDQDGIFAVGLGEDCGAEIGNEVFSENANVWLQVEVEGEVLDPRQSIKSVAYALNSETLQGFPPADTTTGATNNTVLVMNNSGEVILGQNNPTLDATSGTFTIEAQTLTLQTGSGSNGDINLAPDGSGEINLLSDVNVDGYIAAPGATLSATYAGGTALTLRAGPSATAAIMSWQNSGGSTLGTINSAGNIGIGTTNALARLHIVDAANPAVFTQDSTNNVGAFLLSTDGEGAVGTSTGHRLDLYTNSAIRATLDTNGNFGIGDTTPTYRLDVNGTGRFVGAVDFDADIELNSTLTDINGQVGTSGQILSSTGTGVDWVDLPPGAENYWRINLGALSPYNDTLDLLVGANSTASAKFAVLNVNSGTPAASVSSGLSGTSMFMTADGSLSTTRRQSLTIGNSSTYNTTGNVLINPNGTGNVGVGTTTPGSRFDVVSTVGQANIAQFIGERDGQNVNVYFRHNSAASVNNSARLTFQLNTTVQQRTAFEFVSGFADVTDATRTSITHFAGADGGSYGNRMTLYGGNLGIGTELPTARLDINGTASTSATLSFRGTTDPAINILNGEHFGLLTSPGGNAGLTERFTVLNNGNIGVGDTTPGYLLDVNGTGRFTGALQVDTIAAGATDTVITHSSGVLQQRTIDSRVWGSSLVDGAGTTNRVAFWTDANTLSADDDFFFDGTNVGIGSTSPGYKLDVNGDINGTTIYQNGNQVCDQSGNCANLGNYWRLNLGTISPVNDTLDFLVGANATASAKFAVLNVNSGTPAASVSSGVSGNGVFMTADGTLSTTRRQSLTIGNSSTYNTTGNVFINSNGTGNVGIGTTSSASRLDVSSTALNTDVQRWIASDGSRLGRLTETSGGHGWFEVDNSSGTAVALFRADGGASYISSGNFGVGTTAPTAQLDIAGSASTSGTLSFRGTTDPKINILNGENFGIQTSVGGDTGLTERFTVLNNGNVGVGTTAPGYKLSVVTNVEDGGILVDAGSLTSFNRVVGIKTNADSAIRYAAGEGAYVPHFLITGDSYAATPGRMAFRYSSYTAFDFINGSSYEERMRITSDGNLGIGTTTPDFKLQVAGDIAPETTDSDLGSSSLRWDLFANTIDADSTVTLTGLGTGTDNTVLILNGSNQVTTDEIDSRVWGTSLVDGTGTTGYVAYWSDADTLASEQFLSTSRGGLGADVTAAGAGEILYSSSTTAYDSLAAGTAGYVLQSNGAGAPSWIDPITLSTTNYWRLNLGTISPVNDSLDFLVGANATASAKFAVLNVNSGTPTASVSSGVSGNSTYITADGTLSTTRRQSLTIGNSSTYDTTGNVFINSNGTGNVGIGGTNTAARLDVTGTGRFSSTLTASNGLTLTTGALNLTATSGALSLSGMSASSLNFGANNVTFTAGNFNTTATGINTTAIGATTPSTAAFTTLAANSTVTLTGLGTGTDNTVLILNGSNQVTTDEIDARVWGTSLVDGAGTANRVSYWTDADTIAADDDFFFDGTNVGIGTTAPDNALDINGDMTIRDGGYYTTFSQIADTNFLIETNYTNLTFNTPATMSFESAGNEKMDINGTGVDMESDVEINSTLTDINDSVGTSGQVLSSTSTGVDWIDLPVAINYWRLASGALSPVNDTIDLLVGSNASASAKFAVLNVNSGTPTASISSGVSGTSSYLTAAGTLATTRMQGLNIGNSTTGVITLDSGSGTIFMVDDTTFDNDVLLDDGSELVLGAGNDFIATHNGTNTLITSSTGNLTIDNTNATGQTIFQLGTDTNATAFQILNNSSASLFEVDGAGNVGIADSTPTYRLDVNGTGRFTGAVDLDGDLELNSTLTDINGSVGTSGQVLTSTSTGVDWVDASTVGTDDQTLAEVLLEGNNAGATNIDMNDQLILNIGAAGTDFTSGGGLTLAGAFVANGSLTANSTFTLGDNGDTGSINTSDWDISTTGAMTGISGITNDSTFTTSGGAVNINDSSNFATNINTGSSAGTLTLGGGSNNVGINSSIWDITTAGVASGLTGLTSSGTITFSGITANRLVTTTTGGQLTTTISSANAAVSFSDETGSGLIVYSTAPEINTSITTGSSNFDLLNATATTINFAGAASTLNIGPGSTTATSINLAGGSGATGCTVDGATGNFSCSGTISGSNSVWQYLNGAISPTTPYTNNADLLVGSNATASAKFAVLNMMSGTPAASVSSGLSGNSMFMTADGSVSTTRRGTLTIGNSSTYDTTGNVLINSNGTGNVGIGTTTPSEMLDLEGNLQLNNNDLMSANTVSISDPGAGEGLLFNSTSANWRIDVTPLDRSNADGNLNLHGGANNIALWRPSLWVYDATNYTTATAQSNGGLDFTTTGSGHVSFNPGGNVGIADSTPTYKLDVNGTGRFTGAVDLDGDVELNSTLTDINGSVGTSGQVLSSTSTGVDWIDLPPQVNYWRIANGGLSPVNDTLDLLVGSDASTSAKFAVRNVNSGTPAASISSGLSGTSMYMTADGTLATTRRQAVTIGNSSTYNTSGDILLHPNGTGNVSIGTTSAPVKFLVYDATDPTMAIVDSTNGVSLIGLAQDTAASIGTSTNHTLALITNSLPRLVIQNDGNIGIGTTSPDFALQVNGVIAPETTDQDLGTISLRWDLLANTINADSTVTLTGLGTGTDNTVMILNSSNQVTTDEINAKVWDTAVTLVDGTGTANRVSYWTDTDSIAADDDFFFNGTNVGVGTTSPGARLSVLGAASNANIAEFMGQRDGQNINVYFRHNSAADVGNSARLTFQLNTTTQARTAFEFVSGFADVTDASRTSITHFASAEGGSYGNRMTLYGGSLGIGTELPTARLDVNGTASTSATLSFRGTTDPAINILNGEHFSISTSPGGNAGLTERVTLLNSGNLGIGTTTPNAFKLQVAGSVGPNADDSYDLGSDALRWRDLFLGGETLHIGTSTTDEGTIGYNTSTNVFNFGTDSTTNGDIAFFTDMFYLDKSTGNIGISTTTPTYKLDVTGTGRFTGAVDFDADVEFNSTISDVNGAVGTLGQVLSSTVTGVDWVDLPANIENYWRINQGTLSPTNDTLDLLVGANSTASAKFAVLNVNSGTPTASVSSGVSGTGMFMTADGTLATQNRASLTIGNSSTYNTTGNVLLNSNGTGSVGIGTTAPTSTLHVASAGTREAIPASAVFTDSTDTTEGLFIGYDSTNNYGLIAASDLGTSWHNLVLQPSAGNVGIGFTAPAAKLDIDSGSNTSGLRLRGAAETVEVADVYVAADGSLVLSTVAGGDNSQYIDLRPEDNEYGLILRESDGTGFASYANFYVTDAASDYLSINVNSVQDGDALVVNAANNVGIGTTVPGSTLDVQYSANDGTQGIRVGTAGVSRGYVFADGDLRLGIDNNNDSTTNAFSIYNDGNVANELLKVQENGSVGIGTTTLGAKLHVADSGTSITQILSNTATDGDPRLTFLLPSETAWNLGINDGDSDKFMITSAGAGTLDSNVALAIETGGNVGIGDTTPSYKLDVAGSLMSNDLGVVYQNDNCYNGAQEAQDIRVTFPAHTEFTTGSFGSFIVSWNNRQGKTSYLLQASKQYSGNMHITMQKIGGNLDAGFEYVTQDFTTTEILLKLNISSATHQSSTASFTSTLVEDGGNRGKSAVFACENRAGGWAAAPLPDQYLGSGNVGIADGSPTYKLDVNGDIRSTSQFVSTVSTGTSPLSIASTTLVSNLNADMTDGYHVAEASTVSTIAARNSSGDIQARLFRSEYVTTNSSVNYIMTQVTPGVGTDNYIRPSTPAQVRADMGLDAGGAADIWVEKAGDTMTGALTMAQNGTDVINFSANSTSDTRGIAFNGRGALTADYNDGWLRLNAADEFTSGVYTPGIFRVDGPLILDGIVYFSYPGSTNFVNFNSGHTTSAAMNFYDSDGTRGGAVYGDGNGANFGLLDGDGNWAVQSIRDTEINFFVNNVERMNLTSAGALQFDSNLNIGGVVTCIQGSCPTNNAIRLTPNMHLNTAVGNAVIVNWDNGATTDTAQVFRIGNGEAADSFYVTSAGDVYADGWLRTTGATGLYFNAYGTGLISPLNEGGEYGSVATYGNEGGWDGYSLDGKFVFMSNSTDVGIYNDISNRWIMYHDTGTTTDIYEPDSSTVALRVAANGNVGINDTTPTEGKLVVSVAGATTAVYANAPTGGLGVYGWGGSVGVSGHGASYGVEGENESGDTTGYGVLGRGNAGLGVYGLSTGSTGKAGVYGQNTVSGGYGVHGFSTSGYGVYGHNNGAGTAVRAINSSTGYALYCDATTANRCGGNQAWFNASDRRLKKDILSIDNALDKVLNLQGVTYIMKNDPSNTRIMGFIAQDTLQYAPEVVSYDEENDYYGMSTGQLTALIVEAMKQQQIQIDTIASSSGQQLTFTSEGELAINGTNGNYTVTASGNTLITIVGASKAVIGKITAGLINTRELVVQQSATIADLSVTTMRVSGQNINDYIRNIVQQELQTTSLPSGSVAEDFTTNNLTVTQNASVSGILLANTIETEKLTATTSALGSLLAETATIAGDLTVEQDASVAGTLIANNVEAQSSRFQTLESRMAELESIKALTAEIVDATVSGTLFADNIYNFDEKVATAFKKPTMLELLTNSAAPEPTAASPASIYEPVELAGYASTNPDIIATDSAILALDETDIVLGASALFVEKYLEVNGHGYVAQSLGVGETLKIGNSLILTNGAINYQPAGVENPVLAIQSSGQGKLDFLAGVMTIESGQVAITGDLTIAGRTKTDTLLTNLVQPADFGNPFQVQVAGASTESGEIKKSRFEIIDENGEAVATFDSEGNASFQGGISVANQDLADEEPEDDSVTTDKSSGQAKLKSGKEDLKIITPTAKPDSLIYVTPKGSTDNKVLYIKGQGEGEFTVGFDDALGQDVEFNWWIVN